MAEQSNKNISEINNQKNKKKSNSKIKSILQTVLTVIIDLLLCGVFLLIFAYFHHVNPITPSTKAVVIDNPNVESTADTTEETPVDTTQKTSTEEAPDTTPEPEVETNPLKIKFADKFTDGEVIITENSYITDSIHITIDKVYMEKERSTYYVADIYLANIENFKTGFANGEYDLSGRTDVPTMLNNCNGIVGISGDYYGLRDHGLVIRNGVLYRDTLYEDVMVMYYDGSMDTMTANEVDLDELLANGAYQSWSFGPVLLRDGQVIEQFFTPINDVNPRSAIGYYEPGHYSLVVVDGRQYGYSIGITLTQLSQIFYDLGCTQAYNLDGGQTAAMAFNKEMYSQPINGGRYVSDIVYIGESIDE